MGTRGTLGIYIDQGEKLTYNHYDSYPEGLGESIIKELHELLSIRPALEELARALKPVPDRKPLAREVEALRQYADLRVSSQATDEWYVLLRKTQGNLGNILHAGLYEDAKDFPLDSLFCEWGYVVNFDSGELEIYRGFQTEPHTDGRYATRGSSTDEKGDQAYYPIRLIGVIPFETIEQSAEVAIKLLIELTREDAEEEAA